MNLSSQEITDLENNLYDVYPGFAQMVDSQEGILYDSVFNATESTEKFSKPNLKWTVQFCRIQYNGNVYDLLLDYRKTKHVLKVSIFSMDFVKAAPADKDQIPLE